VTRIDYLANKHNALVDAGRLDEAETNAKWAMWLHPDSPVSEHMARQCAVVQKLQRGEWPSSGCIDPAAKLPRDLAGFPDFNEIEWTRLTDRRACTN
jgi:hypothetical protein